MIKKFKNIDIEYIKKINCDYFKGNCLIKRSAYRNGKFEFNYISENSKERSEFIDYIFKNNKINIIRIIFNDYKENQMLSNIIFSEIKILKNKHPNIFKEKPLNTKTCYIINDSTLAISGQRGIYSAPTKILPLFILVSKKLQVLLIEWEIRSISMDFPFRA